MIARDIFHSFGLLLGVVITGVVVFMGPATADTGEREQAAV